ncbi:MAG: glycosyltransferase family 2 protein [Myxococcaceae bacterium]
MGVWDLLLSIAALPLTVATTYLAMLALFSRKGSQTQPVKAARTRFDVIVPAHDEASGIARTVRNLRSLDYPANRFRVIVVADNCTDDTAKLAQEAGAIVWERSSANRGKGFALSFAYQRSAEERFADAVVVIDADTEASPNLLRAFDRRISSGAKAIQAYDGVLNARANWRTQLLSLGFALVHAVRSSARETMSLSAGLHGNGMCFTHALIKSHPHDAFSIVEDLEYGVRLAKAGIRVEYAAECSVLAEMPTGEKASRSQRQRWEQGRRALAKAHGWPLLREGLTRKNGLLVDTGLDLLIPPLSTLVLAAIAGLVLSLAFTREGLAVWLYALNVTSLFFYVLRGWHLSGLGARGLLALAYAPVYVVWKVLLRFRPAPRKGEWVRTARASSVESA